MKEIEILVEVKDIKEEAMKKLAHLNFVGTKEVEDVYFVDPLRSELKPSEDGRLLNSFRLRNKSGRTSMTYKVDRFDDSGIWLYSDEHEMSVGDMFIAEEIVRCLGLKELVRIKNTKQVFETPEYEIVLEDVANLGIFLEVECRAQVNDEDVEMAKQQIREFVAGLGIHVGDELNAGKPELMLRKKV